MAPASSDIDSGHAWLILLVCIIATCLKQMDTHGIFYMAILEKYQRDHYTTIWIQTLNSTMLYLTGLIAGVIVEKRGVRFTALLAATIYTLSFLTSYFALTVEVLYVSLGIGTGISQSLLGVLVYTILPYYFDEKLGMALGFTNAGVGIGFMCFSTLNGYLVGTYGLQGTFLIHTAIAANTAPLGMMMQKPPNTRDSARKIEDSTGSQDEGSEKQSLLADDKLQKTKDGLVMSTPNGNVDAIDLEKDVMPDKAKKSCCEDGSSFFYTTGLDLFTNKYYTMLIVATSFIMLPHNSVQTIIPDHIKWIGGAEWQATSTLVIIGAANTVSRLFIWTFSKDDVYRSIDVLAISSLLSGAGLMCTLFLYEYWMYVILCVLYGVTRGVYIIYYSLLLIQIVGKERGHHGYGVGMTVKGVFVLIGMSSVGALTDLTYNTWGYNVVFLMLGGCEIVAGFILILLRMLYKTP